MYINEHRETQPNSLCFLRVWGSPRFNFTIFCVEWKIILFHIFLLRIDCWKYLLNENFFPQVGSTSCGLSLSPTAAWLWSPQLIFLALRQNCNQNKIDHVFKHDQFLKCYFILGIALCISALFRSFSRWQSFWCLSNAMNPLGIFKECKTTLLSELHKIHTDYWYVLNLFESEESVKCCASARVLTRGFSGKSPTDPTLAPHIA